MVNNVSKGHIVEFVCHNLQLKVKLLSKGTILPRTKDTNNNVSIFFFFSFFGILIKALKFTFTFSFTVWTIYSNRFNKFTMIEIEIVFQRKRFKETRNSCCVNARGQPPVPLCHPDLVSWAGRHACPGPGYPSWAVPFSIEESRETSELSYDSLDSTGFISRSYTKAGRNHSSHRSQEEGTMNAVTWNRRYLRTSDFEFRVSWEQWEQLNSYS